jgi:hypothetical protein
MTEQYGNAKVSPKDNHQQGQATQGIDPDGGGPKQPTLRTRAHEAKHKR